MAEVYWVFKRVVPEFEAVCRGVETTLYTPIISGTNLDLCLMPSPQSLSQMLHANVVVVAPAATSPASTASRDGSRAVPEDGEQTARPSTASSCEDVSERMIVEEAGHV